MKKILTILLICVATTGWGQNTVKYPTYFLNDVVIPDSVYGSPTSSPILMIRTDSSFFTKFAGGGTRALTVSNTGLVGASAISGGAVIGDLVGNITGHEGQILYTAPSGRLWSDGLHVIDSATGYFSLASANADAASQMQGQTGTISINTFAYSTSSTCAITLDTNAVGISFGGSDGVTPWSYAFPKSDGDAGQVLTTDGLGQTSWAGGSGVYLPDTSAGSNITDFVIDSASYTRVGNVVMVNGYISNISCGASTDPSIQLTLPIASNLARVGQLTGQIGGLSNISTTMIPFVRGNTVTDKAALFFGSAITLTNSTATFSFSYLVY